jgi:hypothetical protein
MTQTTLLQLAKQGQPKAIAALINKSLQPKGITAKIFLKGECLQVILEADRVPNQQILAPFVSQGLQNLDPPSIQLVKIYGIQTGKKSPAWVEKVQLNGANPGDRPLSFPTTVQQPPQPPAPAPPPPPVTPVRSAPPPRATPPRPVTPPAPPTPPTPRPPVTPVPAPAAIEFEQMSAEDWEDWLHDRLRLPTKGKWSIAYYYALPKLADLLVEFVPSYGEVSDGVAVRYHGELAYLLLTPKYLACYWCPDFSSYVEPGFIIRLDKIAKIVASKRGLVVHQKRSSAKVYFTHPKLGHEFLGDRLSKWVAVDRKPWIGGDIYELAYSLYGIFALVVTIAFNVAGLLLLLQYLLQSFMAIPL